MPHPLVVKVGNPNAEIYIGRSRSDYHFGNPFSHLKDTSISTIKVQTREEAIKCFREWILGEKFQDVEPERRKWILDNLNILKGKVLVCYCAPLDCHGDILAELANK